MKTKKTLFAAFAALLAAVSLASSDAVAGFSIEMTNSFTITTTSAVIRAKVVTNDAAGAQLWLYWGLTNNGNNLTWPNTNAIGAVITGTVYTASLTGLTPGTTYWATAYATNGTTNAWATWQTNWNTIASYSPTSEVVIAYPNGILRSPTNFFDVNNIRGDVTTNGNNTFTGTNVFNGPVTNNGTLTVLGGGNVITTEQFNAAMIAQSDNTASVSNYVETVALATSNGTVAAATWAAVAANATNLDSIAASSYITNGQLGVYWYAGGNDVYFTGLGYDRTVSFTDSATPGFAAWSIGFTNIGGALWWQLKDNFNNNERGFRMKGRFFSFDAIQNGGGVEEKADVTVNGDLTVTGAVSVLGGGNVVTNGQSGVILSGTLTPTNSLTVTNSQQLGGIAAASYPTNGAAGVSFSGTTTFTNLVVNGPQTNMQSLEVRGSSVLFSNANSTVSFIKANGPEFHFGNHPELGSYALALEGSNATAAIVITRRGNPSVSGLTLDVASDNHAEITAGNSDIRFKTSKGELMQVDQTEAGLLIGTTTGTAGNKLDVNGSAVVRTNLTVNQVLYFKTNTVVTAPSAGFGGIYIDATTNYWFWHPNAGGSGPGWTNKLW